MVKKYELKNALSNKGNINLFQQNVNQI